MVDNVSQAEGFVADEIQDDLLGLGQRVFFLPKTAAAKPAHPWAAAKAKREEARLKAEAAQRARAEARSKAKAAQRARGTKRPEATRAPRWSAQERRRRLVAEIAKLNNLANVAAANAASANLKVRAAQAEVDTFSRREKGYRRQAEAYQREVNAIPKALTV